MVRELKSLRETVVQSDTTQTRMLEELESTQSRVRDLKRDITRVEAQVDLLIRMSQPVARSASAAQAPPNQQGTDPGMAKGGRRKTQDVCAVCVVS